MGAKNDQRTDAIESTINSAQDDSLRDYIDKKDAELDALIEEYEMKLATLDATIVKTTKFLVVELDKLTLSKSFAN